MPFEIFQSLYVASCLTSGDCSRTIHISHNSIRLLAAYKKLHYAYTLLGISVAITILKGAQHIKTKLSNSETFHKDVERCENAGEVRKYIEHCFASTIDEKTAGVNGMFQSNDGRSAIAFCVPNSTSFIAIADRTRFSFCTLSGTPLNSSPFAVYFFSTIFHKSVGHDNAALQIAHAFFIRIFFISHRPAMSQCLEFQLIFCLRTRRPVHVRVHARRK